MKRFEFEKTAVELGRLTRKEREVLDLLNDGLAPADGDPLNTPLDLLPLATRSRNALQRYGCRTLGDAAALSDQEILRMKNLGAASLREIRRVTGAAGNSKGSSRTLSWV